MTEHYGGYRDAAERESTKVRRRSMSEVWEVASKAWRAWPLWARVLTAPVLCVSAFIVMSVVVVGCSIFLAFAMPLFALNDMFTGGGD